MPSPSILDQVRKLAELQKIDTEIYSFKRDWEEKPSYLAKLKEEFEAKKVELKALEEKYKVTLVNHNTLEGDLKVKDEAISITNTPPINASAIILPVKSPITANTAPKDKAPTSPNQILAL